jgi:hypothetical protein
VSGGVGFLKTAPFHRSCINPLFAFAFFMDWSAS